MFLVYMHSYLFLSLESQLNAVEWTANPDYKSIEVTLVAFCTLSLHTEYIYKFGKKFVRKGDVETLRGWN